MTGEKVVCMRVLRISIDGHGGFDMKRIAITLLLLLTTQLTGVQQAHAQSERIAAWLDYACFKIPTEQETTLVEFYYGLLRHEMTFAYVDTGFEATAYVWIEILDENSAPVDTLYKKITTIVKSPQEMSNPHVKITDQIETALKPGVYIVKLTIEDAESQTDESPMSGKMGHRKMRITVPDFNEPQLEMSGIELSYRIGFLPVGMEESLYSPIDKSFRRVIPNPSRIFVDQDSVMFFYSEVYNLAFGMNLNKEFHVGCKILDTYGTVVSDFGRRRYFKPGTFAVASSVLDIHDLSEGSYVLSLKVTDNETGETVTRSKPFQLLTQTLELAPGIAAEKFTEEDAKYLGKVLKYVLNADQRKILKTLSLDGKKRFFEEFWRRSDPNPSTRLNEFKVELFRRFAYANEHYSLSIVRKDDGWQTDRGRVYIVYGEPDEIERYPSTLDAKPFEKWNYFNLGSQGPRFFIFEDETGYGDYHLAHSDANGEPFSRTWDEKLKRGELLKY